MSKPHCCFIPCEAEAEFEMHYDTPDPYDSSEACADHVGHLMQDCPATVVPIAA